MTDTRGSTDWQVYFDERAGIAEFDGKLPRLDAEARAFACCVAEWLTRDPARRRADAVAALAAMGVKHPVPGKRATEPSHCGLVRSTARAGENLACARTHKGGSLD
jgi:hypothetical protein